MRRRLRGNDSWAWGWLSRICEGEVLTRIYILSRISGGRSRKGKCFMVVDNGETGGGAVWR